MVEIETLQQAMAASIADSYNRAYVQEEHLEPLATSADLMLRSLRVPSGNPVAIMYQFLVQAIDHNLIQRNQMYNVAMVMDKALQAAVSVATKAKPVALMNTKVLKQRISDKEPQCSLSDEGASCTVAGDSAWQARYSQLTPEEVTRELVRLRLVLQAQQ
jgi:hypothetical protein